MRPGSKKRFEEDNILKGGRAILHHQIAKQ